MKIMSQVKRTFERKKIDFLIFFVTNKCNSRCKHCFFWKNLNRKGELSLGEIGRIFRNTGKIRDMSLSGGEPILREDIADIVKVIYENSKINSISIPSNGLLVDRLIRVSEKILKECKIKLLINLSIDGPEKIHDYIRGVRGNFKKSVLSARKLIKLREKYPNLYININSVVMNKNIDELPKFMEWIRKNLDADGHYFEVIRGDMKDKEFKVPDADKLEKFYKKALENEEFYFNKRYKKKRIRINLGKKATRIFYLGIVKYLYSLQLNNIRGKKWPFRCLAGKTSVVIYPEGDVAVCELKKPIGNLRDFNYDIKKIMESKKYKEMLNQIKKIKCSCTHDCFIYNTINHTPMARFFYLPLKFLRKNEN